MHNTVAVIICNVRDAAQADWDLNSALWARYFTLNDAQRQMLDRDQQAWRQSLDQLCALPRYQTPEDQAGQAMAESFGRMVLGPGITIPGPQPITQAHVNCMVNAYHARAAMLRSKLTGDALSESQLSPEQHAELQQSLAEKGFLRPDLIGSGTHDGEFGPITRNAIKQFQQSLGASASGFLSDEQQSALLERPNEREAAKQITHPPPTQGKSTAKEPPSGKEAEEARDMASPLAPQRAVQSTKDAWLKLANQCIKNHGGNDCWKVTSDVSPALRDALKGDYRGYVNRCNDHKGDESACNIVATMNTTLFIAGCRQPHHLDTDDWTCSGEPSEAVKKDNACVPGYISISVLLSDAKMLCGVNYENYEVSYRMALAIKNCEGQINPDEFKELFNIGKDIRKTLVNQDGITQFCQYMFVIQGDLASQNGKLLSAPNP